MDETIRMRLQLNCLYEMFRERIEEDVIYIIYSENKGRIDTTIDQLMPIANSSFTGRNFEPKPPLAQSSTNTQRAENAKPTKDITDESSNNEEVLTIDEQVANLQDSIDELLLEKKSSHDKASQYLSKKMYPVTSYYSELGSQLRRMIEEKTNQLVSLLLQKSNDADHIDLHGLTPVQARLVVSELLKSRQAKLVIDKQGEACIDIITGWGKHKQTPGHKIRPTIVALLREKGFEYQHLNKGALRVTVRKC